CMDSQQGLMLAYACGQGVMFDGPLLQLLKVVGLQGLQAALERVGDALAFACEVRDIFTPRRDSQAAHTGNLQDGGVQQQTLGLARNMIVAQLEALPLKQVELQSGGDGFLAYLQRLKLLMQRLQSV